MGQWYAEFIIQTKKQVSNESKLYIKGKDITLEYHEGYVLDPVWFMKDPKEIENDSRITELPQLTGDTIAVTIEFVDGEIKSDQLEISFNTAGLLFVKSLAS